MRRKIAAIAITIASVAGLSATAALPAATAQAAGTSTYFHG